MRKNTARTIGIFGCSLFIFLFCVGAGWAYPSADGAGGKRSYEVQFFSVKLHGKLDYTRLANAGISKIIYRVFQDDEQGGGLYFNNSQFRILKPSLEELIQEFDFKRMDLCAWMIGRQFKWITNTFLFDYEYENGVRRKIPKLDVFNPDAVERINMVFKELASHKIDCILIQDDFTIRYNEGFSRWGTSKYRSVTKAVPNEQQMMADGTLYHLNWKRIKVKQLTDLLKEVVRNCKMVNSAIKVGMNVYYEAPLNIKNSEDWYSHNLWQLAQTDLDYIYLMSYHRQIKNEMKLRETANRELFKKIVDKAYEICKEKLIVKIQIRDWQTGDRIPESEINAYLKLVPAGVKRVCFTPVTLDDYGYLERIIGEPRRHAKGREEKR